MTEAWNFERRRDTCSQFLLGVSVLTNGLPERDTSLEAVRTRMRLSPEEAKFAARRLADEKLLGFEEGGALRSNAAGLARAQKLSADLRSKLQRHEDVLRLLNHGGSPLGVVAALIRADGAPVACGAPDDDPNGSYHLTLVDQVVTLERAAAPAL